MESITIMVWPLGNRGEQTFLLTFLLKDIVRFDLINQPVYYKNGNFRAFFKKGILVVRQEEGCSVYSVPPETIKILKKEMTFTVSKYPVPVSKNHSERKAINWSYIVK